MGGRLLRNRFHDKKITGLECFRKKLERHFFSDVFVQQILDKNAVPKMVLNFYGNYTLAHCLYHFNNGDWGNFDQEQYHVPERKTGLANLVDELQEQNPFKVDIAELSLHLKDVSIIISRIHEDSVTKELGNIMSAISENFVYFTKSLSEMPYEIYIPVFTEFTLVPSNPTDSFYPYKKDIGYFDYWALYFDSNANSDASIYDLKNKEITFGDFLLLG